MTEAEKRTPQEIADAVRETVRTLNEHFQDGAIAGLLFDIQLNGTFSMETPYHEVVAVTISLKI